MSALYEALKKAGAIVSDHYPSGWTDRIEKKEAIIELCGKQYVATLKSCDRDADPLVEVSSKWHLTAMDIH